MSESVIVRHCSPTLAGIKTGNLFNYPYENKEKLQYELDQWNNLLNSKDIYFTVLRKNKKALIYVYRKQYLERDIFADEVIGFLRKYGYNAENIEQILDCLAKKLYESNEFPHEIGVFLSYPLSDIKAFIEKKGKKFKCVGYWKVYTNECEAQKIFAKYKKCTEIYCKKLAQGVDITQLAVAV